METLTLTAILTAGGAVAAAGFVKGLVSLIKPLPKIGEAMARAKAEPLVAFVLSAVLVVLADINAIQEDPSLNNLGFHFAAVVAWFGIARLSMAIHDDINQNPNSLTGVRIGNLKGEVDNEPPANELVMVEEDGPTGPHS